MVTIVIPCYNVAKYIKRCIDSLVDQSFQKFKVILVDDKSTDDTYQYLLQLQATSGLKTMVSLLEDNAADMAFCGYKVVDEHGNSQSRPVYNRSGLISREEAFCLDADSLCMLMVKTDIMKDTLLPDLRNGEDVATVPLLMAKANRYAATVSCLYNYFRRSDSASERPTMKAVESLVCSYRYVQENFPDEYIKEKEFLGIKNLLYSTIITLFSCSNDKRTAKELLNEFETIYPNWKNNPYITSLRIYKKVILRMVSLKLFGVVRLVAILRNVIFR